jgi:hypothetical protein
MMNPPTAQTTLSSEETIGFWIRCFWPLLVGLGVLPWLISALPDLKGAKDQGEYLVVFFVWAFLALSMIGLFFLSLKFYNKNKTKKNG